MLLFHADKIACGDGPVTLTLGSQKSALPESKTALSVFSYWVLVFNYLFIIAFGCAESLLLYGLFSSCSGQGLSPVVAQDFLLQ